MDNEEKKYKPIDGSGDYTVKIEGKGQFLYYKGEKLPLQIKSVVTQDVDDFNYGICHATITVRAKFEN